MYSCFYFPVECVCMYGWMKFSFHSVITFVCISSGNWCAQLFWFVCCKCWNLYIFRLSDIRVDRQCSAIASGCSHSFGGSAWCDPAVPNRQHCCCASHVLLSFWEGRPVRGRGEAGVRSLMSKMGLRWATTSLRWIIDWFVSLWWLIPMPLWVLCIHGWMLGGSKKILFALHDNVHSLLSCF
jgi:hypothetical protein